MLDHGSSAEDSQFTQEEPEICGDVFLHDELPVEEQVVTDNEEKFHHDFDDSDDEMPTYTQQPSQFSADFTVPERIQQIPQYQKILQNADRPKKTQAVRKIQTTTSNT